MADMQLNMNAETRDFMAGVEDAEEALGTIIDTMDELERESVKSADKVEAGLKDITQAAKDTDRSAENIGKGFKKGTREAEEGLDDLKENSKSNAKEVGASFDGSIESIVDGFQGLAAEAFEGWGAAGVAAGVAVAAGIGLVMAGIEQANVDAEKFREKVNELTQELINVSDAGELSSGFISDKLKELANAAEDGAISLEKIKDISDDTGSSFDQLASYFAGNAEGLDELIEKEKELQDTTHDGMEVRAAAVQELDKEDKARDELIGKLEEQQRAQEAAAEAERLYLESGGAEFEAKAAAIDSINAAYDEAAGSILDFKNQETGVLDLEAFIASLEERKKQLADYQTALASSGLTTEQKAALDDMGIEAASAYLDGIKNGTPEQARYLKESLTEAAKDSSGVAKDTIEEAFKKPTEAKVEAKLDTETASRALDTFINKQRSLRIPVRFVDREGREVP